MAATRGDIRIGISGWRYEPWRGVFYPPDLPQREELSFASRKLNSIELNGSFYSMQRPEYYARWHDETPPGFVFSVKGPRFITHVRMLDDVAFALANLFASGLANLRDKLGPILWQLPPMLRFDADLIERFVELLPHDTDQASSLAQRRTEKMLGRESLDYGEKRPLRHAIEVRNHSFADAAFVEILRRHSIALVTGDTAGKWPYAEDLTADFRYLRLHGDEKLYAAGYTDEALERWATRLRAWSEGLEVADARCIVAGVPSPPVVRDIYCYLDNDDKTTAPRDAQRLAQLCAA